MKKQILFTLLFLSIVTISNAQFRFAPTPNDTLQSVRVEANGDVVFSIYAPKARTVTLAGDGDLVPFMGDNKPVVKENPNGVWNITVKDVKPGAYRYHYVVDGINVYDPKNKLTGGKTEARSFHFFFVSSIISVVPLGKT